MQVIQLLYLLPNLYFLLQQEQKMHLQSKQHLTILFLGHLYQRTERPEDAARHFELYSRSEQERRLQRTAKREFEKQINQIFGKDAR